jgi:trehalose 6-phosphate phosphatase
LAPDAVEALAADPRSALVALDFDGTLAPIVDRPQDARPAPGALAVLRRLAGSIGQLAIISGRAADEVVGLGGLDEVPGLLVIGHYGLQTWRDGQFSTPEPEPGVRLARERLPELLAAAPPGVSVEDKQHSVAIHTRQAEDPQRTLDDLTPRLLRLASDAGLEAVPGRYVLELRPGGIDKGAALGALVAESGARTVIYVGDDVGDLPAFRAVATMRDSGQIAAGLAVVAVSPAAAGTPGAASEVPADLRDAADLELPGPAGVVAWLSTLVP